ncbi:hypothetical protein NE857_34075 (plasmid) [Nocardiopsis exhalans]|uniref:Uncharacterized protein n=1 Tax=Nocardiopsis exhalans TaxID=163604 RepID=A0ABY5DJJ0_9ACTN|nr:hypothetical protein [Nocardiopsis exhalans]USY23562.1 hypothetical protein NE857_34075 [Nocardiopsis exhalans]
MDRNEPAPAAAGAAELLTLAEWAQRCGYSQKYAWELAAQEGFPGPEPGQYRMVPKRRRATPLPAGVDPLRAVTLEEFARLIGVAHESVLSVVRAHTEPLPPTVERTAWLSEGHRTVRALLDWWDARPATTTRMRLYAPDKLAPFEPQGHAPLPSPQELGVDPAEEVTLGRFAAIIGEDRGNVGQYRRLHPEQMPRTADGRRVQDLAKGESATFVFSDLHRWWPSRPGSRVGHRISQHQGVTLTGFAKVMGVDPAKVRQRRQREPAQMPLTVDGRRVQDLAEGERPRFDLEALRRWWQDLPEQEARQ